MSNAPIPPGYMRMSSGRLVPISKPSSASAVKVRKLLIVLQYYEADREAAEDLGILIADLERTRNRQADIMLMRRADSGEIASGVQQKLAQKFDRVHLHVCRRTDAKGYPHAANQMFYDLAALMGHEAPYREDYFAFLNLEPDCVPTRPGWIAELVDAFMSGVPKNLLAVGFIHESPTRHMNGVAIYSTSLVHKVRLIGCGPQVCYDIMNGKSLLAYCGHTPLLKFVYRTPTITAADLFKSDANGITPALFHGVKDGSARAAVRARHITFTEKPPVAVVESVTPPPAVAPVAEPVPPVEPPRPVTITQAPVATTAAAPAPKRPNVYTYFSSRGRPSAESQAILAAWSKGWISRGWNPVILTLREAAMHPRYEDFSAAVEKLPCAKDRQQMTHDFNRWLALDLKGGGLMVGNNVLPTELTPDKLTPNPSPVILYSQEDGLLAGAWLPAEHAKTWIEDILKYDAQPTDLLAGKPDVSDATVFSSAFDSDHHETRSSIITFPPPLPGKERASAAMERYLSGQ